MTRKPISLHVLIAFLLLHFILPVHAQYCTPTYFQGCTISAPIIDFRLNGASSTSITDLATGCSSTSGFPPVSSYRDMHASMSVTMAAGASYTVTASTSALSTADFQLFIDFNDNNSFLDAGESVGGGTLSMLGTATSFTITIPTTAAAGSHRMRAVSSGDASYPSITPCPSYSLTGGGATLGEVHDYTAIITGASSACSPVASLLATSITSSSANLSWSAVTGATSYEWSVTTTATPPASGTATTSTSAIASTLLPATTYYAHVRTICTSSASSWVSIPFTTLSTTACAPISGLSVTNITATSATISWTSVSSGAPGYQYIINNLAAAPTISGINTTDTFTNATSLLATTTYYAHVRDSCAIADFSSWATIPFTTLGTTATLVTNSAPFQLHVAPNPVTDKLQVFINKPYSGSAYLLLTDVSGTRLNSYQLLSDWLNIDLSKFSAGIYFVKYVDAQYTQTLKIYKQ